MEPFGTMDPVGVYCGRWSFVISDLPSGCESLIEPACDCNAADWPCPIPSVLIYFIDRDLFGVRGHISQILPLSTRKTPSDSWLSTARSRATKAVRRPTMPLKKIQAYLRSSRAQFSTPPRFKRRFRRVFIAPRYQSCRQRASERKSFNHKQDRLFRVDRFDRSGNGLCEFGK